MPEITRVSVLSTGTVTIRPDHAASRRLPVAWWLLTSRTWTKPLPINVYVIEHEEGVLVFDTGQDRLSVTDPGYFPGGFAGFLYRRLAQFQIPAEQSLRAGLQSLGIDIADVSTAVLSHLHQDHIGGLRELTGAEVLVSVVELSEVDRSGAVFAGLMREHILLPGLQWKPVVMHDCAELGLEPFTQCHDVFGDGSCVLFPTPGHTVGSLSMLLRQDGMPPMLFVGDLSYDVEGMSRGVVPGIGARRIVQESTARVLELQNRLPGLVVLAAHDPAARGMLERALKGAK